MSSADPPTMSPADPPAMSSADPPTVSFTDPPAVAAWTHRGARAGTEVAALERVEDGWLACGSTAAVEDGEAWVVDYELRLFPDWRTRSAHVTRRLGRASRTTAVEADGHGRWWVDGVARRDLHGCRDVDLESSALTNAFPVHRLALEPGGSSGAPAVYVRASLAVERLEQTYTRVDAEERLQRFRYRAPAFDFTNELRYDAAGFALDHPGIAVRAL